MMALTAGLAVAGLVGLVAALVALLYAWGRIDALRATRGDLDALTMAAEDGLYRLLALGVGSGAVTYFALCAQGLEYHGWI